MKTPRRAVPYSLLGAALLAAVIVPLGLKAAAEPSPAAGAPARRDPAVSPPATGTARPTRAADSVRLSGPAVVWTGATKTYVAFGSAKSGKAVPATAFTTLTSAAAAAATWSFPAPGTSGPVSQGSLCLTVPAGPPGTPVTASTCAGTPAQTITLVDSANGLALRSAASTTNFVDFSPAAGAFQTHTQDRGDGLQTSLLKPVGQVVLSVTTVQKGDIGTATISGRGTPGARVLNGTSSVPVDSKGFWSMSVTGVDPKGATIRFAQSINGDLYTHADAVVTAWPQRPAAPTAAITFSDDVFEDAVVHGTGAEGAAVTIRSGTTVIGTALVVDGKWSTSIGALGAGEHTVSVTQTLAGLESPALPLTIDYGAAVAITSPSDGATVPAD